jgi:Plavaka transposase
MSAERASANTDDFRDFKRQLFHTSVAKVLAPFKTAMTTPEIVRYYDNYLRRTLYGVGPYIADYQEQVVVFCIVQGWCSTYECN